MNKKKNTKKCVFRIEIESLYLDFDFIIEKKLNEKGFFIQKKNTTYNDVRNEKMAFNFAKYLAEAAASHKNFGVENEQ